MPDSASVPSASFPPEARLHRPIEFAAALKGRRLARGALFVLTKASVSASTEVAAPARARLGLIIAKRYAPHAVTRNAIKRVVRESFRLCQTRLPAADYVVRLHAKVTPASLTVLKRGTRLEVDAHFERAAR
jgi:ribonuclease P protein component